MKRPVCFLLALALHLAVILPWPGDERSKAPPTKVAAFMVLDAELMEKDETLNPSALRLKCPDTHEGIGIKRNFGGVITQVAKGWPADRAGIQTGDIIEPWDLWPADGFMEFTVTRNNVTRSMRLKTERICFRDAPW